MNKKIIFALMMTLILTETFTVSAPAAQHAAFFNSISEEETDGFIDTAAGVTQEMCDPLFWRDKNEGCGIGPDEVLITKDEVENLNRLIIQADGSNMHDLENLKETYDATALKNSLALAAVAPDKKAIYAATVSVNKTEYYGAIADAIRNTGYEGEMKNRYAVAVHRTEMLVVPTADFIGYSAADTDNENVDSAVNVNEPFVIRQKATVSGNDFYWGYSDNCSGWIKGDDLAVCADKEEWLDSWKVDIKGDNFIVVTDNNITLEPSYYTPQLSKVELTFGTILKSVPEKEIPAVIDQRGSWNNRVVYLPTRDEDGKYVRRCALISQHYKVSEGYPDMTQGAILETAFNNLGDRYGWGGMLSLMDCSLFTRNVYRCFGLSLPRNTSWQQTVPGRLFDLSKMTDEEKLRALRKMPAGSLLYFPGHTMIYTGAADDMAYVISDTGSLSDSEGELSVRNMFSIILNPLSVRRRAGTTWLTNLTAAVLPFSEEYAGKVFAAIQNNEEPEKDIIIPEQRRVAPQSGQSFASSKDTLPLDTFTGSTKNLYIDFENVEGSGVESLDVTVVKGSVITTRVSVNNVECDKKTASVRINKKNGLASLKMKSSGSVRFNLADGKSHSVRFTVDTPKPQKKAVKQLLAAGSVSLNACQLFGTSIDRGTLTIVRGSGPVKDNVLYLTAGEKKPVKLCYTYLDKKYTISIKP